MKKLFVSILFILVTAIASASCYSAWISAFNSAYSIYQADKAYCESEALSHTRCMREADAVYGQAIDEAGEAYYHCTIK